MNLRFIKVNGEWGKKKGFFTTDFKIIEENDKTTNANIIAMGSVLISRVKKSHTTDFTNFTDIQE